MSRMAGGDVELPWEFNEPGQDERQADAIASARPFQWRDHAGKIVLAAPLAAAVLTASIWTVVPALAHWGMFPSTMNTPIEMAAFVFNGGLAIMGAACGGILTRGSVGLRVETAIGACAVGGFGYLLALLGLAVVLFCVSAAAAHMYSLYDAAVDLIASG